MNPFDIFHQLKSQINWDDDSFDKWRFRTDEEMFKEKKAKCIEAICYLCDKIPNSESVLYRLRRKDGLPIHARNDEKTQVTWIHMNLVFQFDGEFYIAEWMWLKSGKIIGSFKSRNDALHYSCQMMQSDLTLLFNTEFEVNIIPFKKPSYRITLNEFQDFVLSENKSI